jgi:hypothetical protein
MSDASLQVEPEPLRLRDALYVLVSPRSVFRRMQDTPAYGWTLAFLILLITLLGVIAIQSGLVDLRTDRMTEQRLARLELDQKDLITQSELSRRMEDVREEGEFWKVMAQAEAVLFAPISMVVSILLIGSLLYAAVALSGRKPEYHTLVSICVYAAVVDVLAAGLRVAMMMIYRTDRVETSLSVLTRGMEGSGQLTTLLSGFDPFVAWFWVLVRTGLVETWQLGRVASTVVCLLLFVVSCGLRVAAAHAGQGQW